MPKHFSINKSEERFNRWHSETLIPLHELVKLVRLFPDKILENLVSAYKDSGYSNDDPVENLSLSMETIYLLAPCLKQALD